MTFSMGLTIPEHEMQLSRDLSFAAYAHCTLVNDIFSWPKEREAEKTDDGPVMNAIDVLMRQYPKTEDEEALTEEEAIEVCRRTIKEYGEVVKSVIEESKDDKTISADLRKYVEAMSSGVSGNVVWSVNAPRYFPDMDYPPNILSMMAEAGVGE